MSFRLTQTEACVDAPAAESLRVYELSSRSEKQRVQKCYYQIRKYTHTHFLLLQPMSMKYGQTSAARLIFPYKIACPVTTITTAKNRSHKPQTEPAKPGKISFVTQHKDRKGRKLGELKLYTHMNKNELISLCFLLSFVTFRSSICNSFNFNIHKMLIW